jgi:hypothetical protein
MTFREVSKKLYHNLGNGILPGQSMADTMKYMWKQDLDCNCKLLLMSNEKIKKSKYDCIVSNITGTVTNTC